MSNSDFYKQLCKEEEKLLDLITSVRKLKSQYEGNKKTVANTSKTVKKPTNTNGEVFPTVYDALLSQRHKTYLAVAVMGEGTVDDAGHELHELEPAISIEKGKKIATIHCSQLYRDGVIEAEKFGNKYKYKFIGDSPFEEEEEEPIAVLEVKPIEIEDIDPIIIVEEEEEEDDGLPF